jgi:hypothetical protein
MKYTFENSRDGIKVTKHIEDRVVPLGYSESLWQALAECSENFEPGTVVDMSSLKEWIYWEDGKYQYASDFNTPATWISTISGLGNN